MYIYASQHALYINHSVYDIVYIMHILHTSYRSIILFYDAVCAMYIIMQVNIRYTTQTNNNNRILWIVVNVRFHKLQPPPTTTKQQCKTVNSSNNNNNSYVWKIWILHITWDMKILSMQSGMCRVCCLPHTQMWTYTQPHERPDLQQ